MVGDSKEEGGTIIEEEEEEKKRRKRRQRGKEGTEVLKRKEQWKSCLLTFLHALTIFFKSYSEESPCTVVKVLRPFRCWILICTRPSWTSSSEPLIASAKGSAKRGRKKTLRCADRLTDCTG